jgi:hypothetical protein
MEYVRFAGVNSARTPSSGFVYRVNTQGGEKFSKMAAVLLAASFALAGCKDPPAPQAVGGPSASSSAPLPPPTPVARMPPRMVLPAASASAPAHQEVVEAEFEGRVSPFDPSKPTIVFASYDDCLGKTAANIGQMPVKPDGKFGLEIFVKWGSKLSLCAAQITTQEKPTRLYGKAAAGFEMKGRGDMEFEDITIEMKPGPPRVFPGPRPSGGF